MKGKLIIVLCVAVFCISGSSAFGNMYTFDSATASQLRAVSFSDGGATNYLNWVGYNDGTGNDPQDGIPVYNPDLVTYGANMFYNVGFSGNLADTTSDPDKVASVKVGALGLGVLSQIKLAGTIHDFYLPISNDDDDTWEVMLYAEGASPYSTGWVPLLGDTQTTLWLNFGVSGINFNTLTDIGFGIRSVAANPNDNFHVSVVPVPGAVLLGVLGLAAAGIKLRKFA